jgi:hypothetical protein
MSRSGRSYGDGGILDLVSAGAHDAISGGVASAIGGSIARTIQFKSNVSPTVTLDVAGTLATSSGPSVVDPIMNFVKPTIILDGGVLGHQVIAPNGEAGNMGWLFPVVGVGLVFGAGYLLGRLMK